VTARQARELAGLGARSHATQWRVILTGPEGRAIAVTRVPRPRLGPRRAGIAGTPLVESSEADVAGGLTPAIGRVTVIIPNATPDGAQPQRDPPDVSELIIIRARIVAAARRARATARRAAEADQHVPGGCAHAAASTAYRPPPRVAELVVARDQTCRNPRCGQPAWRADLDHTRPYHLGGLTCRCNLGGLCRAHHQLKQLPGWTLTQPQPGTFQWTTPAGRAYTTRPDQHNTG
jgi:hypothetical protein